MTPGVVQRRFFRRLADPLALRAIFDHLPEAYFFVKDREGRIMAASATILARLGFEREEQFLGLRDHDVFPRLLADAYAADDALVFRTGRPLVNRLELWLDEHGRPDWCVTTKVPLLGRGGAVVGLMGVTRRDVGRAALQPSGEAMRAVQHLRESPSDLRTTGALARRVGTSPRTLQRRIREAFGVAPHELMLRVRVQLAAEALLASGDRIADIALACGFCDQSTFTQHFRSRMGVTPARFRRRHGRPDGPDSPAPPGPGPGSLPAARAALSRGTRGGTRGRPARPGPPPSPGRRAPARG